MAARKLQAQQPATKSRGALPCRDNPPRRAYAEARGAGPAGCVAHASAFRQQGTSCKRSRHKDLPAQGLAYARCAYAGCLLRGQHSPSDTTGKGGTLVSLAKRDAPQLHRVATLINMLQARSQGETLKKYGPVPSMV